MHYDRWRANGTTDRLERPGPKPCKVDGCDRRSKSRGWCSMHYDRWRWTGDPGPAAPLRPSPSAPNPEPQEERDPLPAEDIEPDSAQTLFLAVIDRALEDATGKTYRRGGTLSRREKAEARQWLTTYSPDLQEVCDLAGLAPSYLIAHARLLIHNHDRVARMANAFRTPSTPSHPGGTSQFSDPLGRPARGHENHISKKFEIETRH